VAQVERIFALADQYDVDLDLHLDVGDSPDSMHIHQVLDLTGRYKRGGRVVAGHMAKLSLLPPEDAAALGRRLAALPFGHGAQHALDRLTLFDSYHCSRYNTNTGVLTPDMFREVFAAVRRYLDARSQPTTTAALSSGGKTG